MNDLTNKFHFHMFDGAAAGGGAASSAGEGAGELSSAAEPIVVYGKAEAGEDGESQVGTDTQTEENADDGVDLDKEFEELIAGKYKEQYSNRVQDTLHRRFKNNADFERLLNEYKEATAPLAAALGLDIGDIEGLRDAIENNDGLYAHFAEEQGMTPEQMRENLQLRADAQKGRTMQAEILRQQQQKAMFAEWDAQAEQLKEVFPSFNLEEELKNPEFLDNLDLVKDVKRAFQITHMDDILSGAMEMSAKEAQQQTVRNIQQKAARPVEGAMSTPPAIIRKDDPSKMTAEERRIVAEKARRGERIVF